MSSGAGFLLPKCVVRLNYTTAPREGTLMETYLITLTLESDRILRFAVPALSPLRASAVLEDLHPYWNPLGGDLKIAQFRVENVKDVSELELEALDVSPLVILEEVASGGSYEDCYVCGKEEDTPYWVEVTAGGLAVVPFGTADRFDSGYAGWQSICGGCIVLFPTPFYRRKSEVSPQD